MDRQEAIALADMFNVRKGKEDQAFRFLDTFVRERVGEKVKEGRAEAKPEMVEKISAQVDRAMEKEIRHLATKEDLADLEMRISSKFQTQFYWFVGLFVTMMLGFIATLFTLLQMQTSRSIPAP